MCRFAIRLTKMLVCPLLFAAGAFAAEPLATESEASSDPTVPEGISEVYRIPGILSTAQVATAIHCTNLGAATIGVYVFWHGHVNGAVCISSDDSVAPMETTTIATGATAAYTEDVICGPVPTIDRGIAYVAVTAQTTLICTAQILDRAGATPAFVSTLELYRR